ncbi:DUF3541 domain-containing protein [Vibrio methylphosphonaticus]|uniref:DUF3541 domain-containing protein n=1 Tax=Vibrio methylphosphonaticus TaxID=2946866 RepID=UPI00202AA1EF|nr:DUF3541 domain-containing protein [Vibrio methylphosphonaticus]MCL9774179.1 DUF3541 domain-containing protein [Vibrio methylphosphonaticus]
MRIKLGLIGIVASVCMVTGATAVHFDSLTSPKSFDTYAQIIKQTYEAELFTLSVYKQGHYGLRMYRQTQDSKYSVVVWNDMANVVSRLNTLSKYVKTRQEIRDYSNDRLNDYKKGKDERSQRRYAATKSDPEYFYMGLDLLRYMARLNEYGLQHKDDKTLRARLKRYDFQSTLTNPTMIKAWAAQLANQAYWLKQIGEQDYTQSFIQAFQETYPEGEDYRLNEQQFANKLYGMTHIILADSEYYQRTVNESDHQWIFDYFRKNIDDIIAHTKEDVIAEVGITFLLAGLDDDPVVDKTRQAIIKAINKEKGMIPSASGDFDFAYGEHRNVLAIMLLSWQAPKSGPNLHLTPKIFSKLPYGAVKKPL